MVKETEKKIQNMLYDMNNEEVLKEKISKPSCPRCLAPP